jgi:hypothetical protein
MAMHLILGIFIFGLYNYYFTNLMLHNFILKIIIKLKFIYNEAYL